ncbi:MAG TPA: hypothetical protein VLX90_21490 [Steroidobacteraceae bacterium]|nr:hypothetical protein [Steroidobacteraceae bacterium]
MSWRTSYALIALMGLLLFPLGLALGPRHHPHWGLWVLGGMLITLAAIGSLRTRRSGAWQEPDQAR